ncbi:MAG: hypothetical protein CL920_10825 [Deltaproteobacteria bacterium]|mgnify:CR=1 FL=1|nr:hypothetical protein [Deltaproteobacteria bacterium]
MRVIFTYTLSTYKTGKKAMWMSVYLKSKDGYRERNNVLRKLDDVGVRITTQVTHTANEATNITC